MYFQNYGFIMGNPLNSILFKLYMQNYWLLNLLNRNVYK